MQINWDISMMGKFFDDSPLYGPKPTIRYLTEELRGDAWDVVKQSGVRIKEAELAQYALSLGGEHSFRFGVIALSRKEIIGFALFSDYEEEVFLNHLYVCPGKRFQGVGSLLMKRVQQYAGNREISFIDTSNNFMPWMSVLPVDERANLINALGSFYSR
ncbi:GNAT family N-acetyltransferase [Legionella lytica]|uniref:GNAT family N-acetyltransferase n=1 Tax=Legionella lytica TaxID=96232 RepID=A0ABW8D4I5_9GAMM